MNTTGDIVSCSWAFPFCPEPPGWPLDWPAIESAFEWVRAMAGSPQDPLWHAEGDVLVHTRMVCEALVASDEWRRLGPEERSIVFAAALMHDVAKPACTREENGRITSRGHARKGAHLARMVLWRLRPDDNSEQFFRCREAVVALVRHHGLPLAFLDRPDPQRAVIEAGQTARCDRLALLAEADVRGRECRDRRELLDRVGMFREFARENRSLDGPRAFASDHSRFVYFHKAGASPHYEAFDDTQAEVVLMAGLPGAGKNAWVRRNLPDRPVVSLDDLRQEMDVDPARNQGRIAAEARERARVLLRNGRPFVWNATNTTRMLRTQLIGLFYEYRARTRIVYVEPSWNELFRRNRDRTNPVPEAVIERLAGRLDVPDLTETHRVEWHRS
jgi:predicted kinase